MVAEKQTGNNGKDPKTGRFVEGNSLGGRPKGSKNKFTMVKEALADVFLDTETIEVLKKTIVRDKRDLFGKLIKDEQGQNIKEVDKGILAAVVKILPKDPLIVNEGDTHITYVWGTAKDESSPDPVRPAAIPAGES